MRRPPPACARPAALLALAAALALTAPARAEDRVAKARKNKAGPIAALFRAAKVAYPPGEIYVRIFKLDRELELWAGPRGAALTHVKTWPVCASSGEPGPKRREGDGQVPEGFYFVSVFNPFSNFHLSLGLDYPNASDRVLGEKGRLGGAIMIHGNCVTIGCVPIEDDGIEELYVIASDAKAAGQQAIPVHVFPARLDEAGRRRLEPLAAAKPELKAFWDGLQPGWDLFERTHRPPVAEVDRRTGAYRLHAPK
jgi:murein L,D-transpeptidase YafK